MRTTSFSKVPWTSGNGARRPVSTQTLKFRRQVLEKSINIGVSLPNWKIRKASVGFQEVGAKPHPFYGLEEAVTISSWLTTERWQQRISDDDSSRGTVPVPETVLLEMVDIMSIANV